MGNCNSCIRHLNDVILVLRGGSVECGHGETAAAAAFGVERGSSSGGGHVRYEHSESLERATRSGNVGSAVEERIESSKVHWSELTERASDDEDEEVAQENRQVFEELMLHDIWGHFFKTFNYDTKDWLRAGELVVGKKFAEGGQAELFYAEVIWSDPKGNEDDMENGREWVLKVFKKGTRLRELQSQWPLGYLQWIVQYSNPNVFLPMKACCEVFCGTLLEDGRFAFLMGREHEDLRSRIDRAMLNIGDDQGPFSNEEVESIMFDIAQGMDWLHSHNIVHRDLKAANVLVFQELGYDFPTCYVADFECSIGVVGTGFFRAPEILQAIKDKVVGKDLKVFSKEGDVYSYGMTCYEVLTGKLPFQGHRGNDYDLVLNGQRPRIPEYVDSWIEKLVKRCWDVDCAQRPSFREIVEILSCNSAIVRQDQIDNQEWEEDAKRKHEEKLLRSGLVVEI